MYPLTKLATPFKQTSPKYPLAKLETPFKQTSPMYPLTKLETHLNKESIDKISNTFCQNFTYVPIGEVRNPF